MGIRLGRYETTERLAAGGMATVYLGRAVGEGGFERLVAIKVMHEHVAAEAEFRDMFLDEARLAARIHHPNVVGVIDIQKAADDQLFLVMEYIDGPSLFQLRKKLAELGERIPLDVTLRVFVDTLTGLHAAHELLGSDGAPLQLVHRDVSPQNILLGRDGITRITDFGVARAEERITSTRGGQLKGKVAYMPPEQIRNEDLDRRGDVYAAGVALWEALTGRRLFDAMSDAAIVHMIASGVQQSPRDVDPSVPAPISDACMRALALRREERPVSASAFADALEAAAREAGVEVASSRRVASFLASLPKSVSSRPGPMPAEAASRPKARDLLAGTPTASASAAERATIPEPALRVAPPTESTTTRSLITDNEPVELPKRSRAPLWIGAGLTLVAVGVAAWRLSLSGSSEVASPTATQAASATPTPTSSAQETPPGPGATASTSTSTSTAAPAVAAASSAPGAPSALATSGPSGGAAGSPAGGKGAGRPPPTGPKGTPGVGYDPGEL